MPLIPSRYNCKQPSRKEETDVQTNACTSHGAPAGRISTCSREGRRDTLGSNAEGMSNQRSVRRFVRLRMQLWLPDQSKPLEVDLAAVRWVKIDQFAVSFLKVSPDAQARLEQVYRSLHEAQQQPEGRLIQIPPFAILESKQGSASRGGARRGFWESMDDL